MSSLTLSKIFQNLQQWRLIVGRLGIRRKIPIGQKETKNVEERTIPWKLVGKSTDTLQTINFIKENLEAEPAKGGQECILG